MNGIKTDQDANYPEKVIEKAFFHFGLGACRYSELVVV